MSHSRRQSRPPPKNPLPARFLQGFFRYLGQLPFRVSFISLASGFRLNGILQRLINIYQKGEQYELHKLLVNLSSSCG